MGIDVYRVVVVDDAPTIRELFKGLLARPDREVVAFASADAALASPDVVSADLVVTDLVMPGRDGLSLLREVRALPGGPEVVLVTGEGGIPHAVEAMRAGAFDVLDKKHATEKLPVVVDRALAYRAQHRALWERQHAADVEAAFQHVIGNSGPLRRVVTLAREAAQTLAPVLITGESGTGKEVIAQAIHKASPNKAGPFVAFNCAAITATLIESELFGHEKGAFTGAVGRHAGAFEQAAGGTLFLDEIGDLDLGLQSKLLRVLQERTFQRVGGSDVEAVRCRIVAATNVNLSEAVAQERFREDLYFRLKVVHLPVPPLRERPEDILPLAIHFLRQYAQEYDKPARAFSLTAQAELLASPWPGNVRELQNAVERAVIFCNEDTVDLEHLPDDMASISREVYLGSEELPPAKSVEPIVIQPGTPWAEIERIVIERTLEAYNGVKEHTAKVLGLGVRTIHRKLREYEQGSDADRAGDGQTPSGQGE